MDQNARFNDLFEKHFPKVYERPGLYPYKDDIRDICLKVFSGENFVMPWDSEL